MNQSAHPHDRSFTVEGVQVESVRFDCGDSFIAGHLYFPVDGPSDEPRAAAVLAGLADVCQGADESKLCSSACEAGRDGSGHRLSQLR